MNSLRTFALYFLVSMTGAAVMVIELLGTRLIAPFYGASLYVWSSLISVTMMSLAIGYFVGGHWADRAGRRGLSLIVAAAGLFTLLIPLATRPVLLATDPLGLRGGAFVSALVLFSPSLTCLGMVGPFAIKWATARIEGVGSSAGTVYAISTLGSVLGTLILGFFLFPLIGSREILIGLAIGLLVLAGLAAVFEGRTKEGLAALGGLVLLALGAWIAVVSRASVATEGFQVRSEQESLYGWVRVIDQPAKNMRLLTSDASAIGAANIKTGESLLSYQDIVGLMPLLRPGMKRALIVGQGAGHMAGMLRDRFGIVSDTLEIDPAVATAASDYFGFKPTGQQIVGDARYEIRHLSGPFDLIIHDCFTGGSEPGHLLTVEALTQLRGLLAENGLLAVNFLAFGSGLGQSSLASVARTLGAVLPHQQVFISEPGKDFNDFIFLAGRQAIDLSVSTLPEEARQWLHDRSFAVSQDAGELLTDNLNPLEHLQIAKAEHYRQFLMGLFGAELFVR